ncbi:hypothetical protein [Mycobacterium sp.]|uniref:hypothetical protein n=1 Tax=Mycobacterium sp. TaxID=1785 RepID=UPI003C72741D
MGGLVLLVLLIGTIVRLAVWIALGVGIVLLGVALWKFTGWLDRRLDAWERKRTAKRDGFAAIARRGVPSCRTSSHWPVTTAASTATTCQRPSGQSLARQ